MVLHLRPKGKYLIAPASRYGREAFSEEFLHQFLAVQAAKLRIR
jgi:hypothetical protein